MGISTDSGRKEIGSLANRFDGGWLEFRRVAGLGECALAGASGEGDEDYARIDTRSEFGDFAESGAMP